MARPGLDSAASNLAFPRGGGSGEGDKWVRGARDKGQGTGLSKYGDHIVPVRRLPVQDQYTPAF